MASGYSKRKPEGKTRTSHKFNYAKHLPKSISTYATNLPKSIYIYANRLFLLILLGPPRPKTTSSYLYYLPHLAILTSPSSPIVPDMDTSAVPPKRSMRADITRKYDQRVAETIERVDPNRAKARTILRDVKDGVVTPFEGTFVAPKDAPKPTSTSYMDAPLLTLRQLMPGFTAEDDEDDELDQSFRADKIEFLVMIRAATEEEIRDEGVILDAGEVDWDIPNTEEFEDAMGQVFNIFTDVDTELVHAFKWSSVGGSTGVGCFSVSTGRLDQINDIRGLLRTIIYDGKCYESFPKKAMVKSYSLSAFFPRACKFVSMDKLIEWLFSCNRGLKGTLWPSQVKQFPDDHENRRKRGARILTFTGDQKFMDSLHAFPRGYPFTIKLSNVYIQGGERVRAGATATRRRRPKMTDAALKELLARHGKDAMDDAEAENDAEASAASARHVPRDPRTAEK